MFKKLTNAVVLSSLVLALAVPALAQETTSTPPVMRPAPNLACMQAAVEKRDNAIIAAADAHYATMKKALETRRDALKAAWGLADKKERRVAIRAAWAAFKTTRRQSVETFRKAKNTAWAQFNIDRKDCGAAVRADDATTSSMDSAT